MSSRFQEENYYQKSFAEYVKEKYPNHTFIREFPLHYDSEKTQRKKDVYMPDYKVDFIQIDTKRNLHLWEAKLLHSQEILGGRVIGQIIFYDWLFKTTDKKNLIKTFISKKYDDEVFCKKRKFNFKTWNLLVCGGEGWELAGGVNPIIWTYFDLSEEYFKDEMPTLYVHHFYKTSTGFDLKELSELSIFTPETMHPESYEAYLRNQEQESEI